MKGADSIVRTDYSFKEGRHVIPQNCERTGYESWEGSIPVDKIYERSREV